ncbi:hypothetical protein B0H13DRAFT_2365933 [Mycena leptocephala]|nr:hypothetical protein B0H13DRAFT_2365933 [Mycena leptocephala]
MGLPHLFEANLARIEIKPRSDRAIAWPSPINTKYEPFLPSTTAPCYARAPPNLLPASPNTSPPVPANPTATPLSAAAINRALVAAKPPVPTAHCPPSQLSPRPNPPPFANDPLLHIPIFSVLRPHLLTSIPFILCAYTDILPALYRLPRTTTPNETRGYVLAALRALCLHATFCAPPLVMSPKVSSTIPPLTMRASWCPHECHRPVRPPPLDPVLYVACFALRPIHLAHHCRQQAQRPDTMTYSTTVMRSPPAPISRPSRGQDRHRFERTPVLRIPLAAAVPIAHIAKHAASILGVIPPSRMPQTRRAPRPPPRSPRLQMPSILSALRRSRDSMHTASSRLPAAL